MAELKPAEKRKVRKPLLWIGLASIVMMFAGLTSGYVVSRSSLMGANEWVQFGLPDEFTYATVVIIISSLTMIGARLAIGRGKTGMAQLWLGLTLLLGLSFAIIQYYGWQDLIDRGLFFTGPESNTASSWVYVITVLHWLHVISGIIVLMVTLLNAFRQKYSTEDHLGLSLSAIYWHFLDGLWVYLFLFLLFIR